MDQLMVSGVTKIAKKSGQGCLKNALQTKVKSQAPL